jgi:hypothetical protein
MMMILKRKTTTMSRRQIVALANAIQGIRPDWGQSGIVPCGQAASAYAWRFNAAAPVMQQSGVSDATTCASVY